MRISDWSSDVCSSDLGGGCLLLYFAPKACRPRRARITGLLESKAPAPRLWVAEQVGTRMRMPLGVKSRRRRRPSADAGGHPHPRAFAPGAPPSEGACFSFRREKRIQKTTKPPAAQ